MALKRDLQWLMTVSFLVYFTTAIPVQPMRWKECQDMKKKDSTVECCILQNNKVQAFNKNTHMCCNSTVTRHAADLQCCHHPDEDTSAFYDSKVSKCCNGRLHKIVDGDDDMCCGDNVYNKKTHLCCQIEGHIYISYRVYEIESALTTCPVYYCNKQQYDATKQVCCNDKVLTAQPNHACCGDELYNEHTHICCNGRKHRKIRHNQQCCGQIGMGKDDKCCGEKLLKKNEKCCGGKSYKSSVSLCTADSKIVPIGTPLCDNKEYNPEKQVCCGVFAMVKLKEDDNACCKPRGHRPGVTFNNKNMTCKDGKVYSTVKCGREHTPDKYTCCNGFAFNQPAKNSVCCQGKAEWFKRHDQEHCRPPLCKDKWYDDKLYDCCDNELINPQKFRCIDKKAYGYYNKDDRLFSNLHICGRYAISKSYNCCAGLMPYKTSQYTCPLSDFGNQKPFKPRKFPFWPIIKCRSEKKTGRIVDAVENHGRITVTLKAKKSGKEFTMNISNKQYWTIMHLKSTNAYVNVYFEKSIRNELFLGEYGAIERRRRRSRKVTEKATICNQINTFFQSSSS